MKHSFAVLLIALGMPGCGHYSPAAGDFIAAEGKKIEAHKKELIKLGRMDDRADAWRLLGTYGWHGNGGGYFGAYSFSEAAFRQAKRGWFLHAKVPEGSNELQPQDDWDNDAQGHTIKFDQSIIGYTMPGMYMAWFKNGNKTGAWFTAKIVGISEDGHTAILDKRAPHQAEQWQLEIVPADWVDMCGCTNNFSPPFVDGHPDVKDFQ